MIFGAYFDLMKEKINFEWCKIMKILVSVAFVDIRYVKNIFNFRKDCQLPKEVCPNFNRLFPRSTISVK